jgi:hypothetical protein
MAKVMIEIDLSPERAQRAVGAMREVKKFYESTADTRIKQGKLSLELASEKLEPIADALLIVVVAELALTEAAEPGLEEAEEFADLSAKAEPAQIAKAVCRDVTAENEAECGDCRKPRCRFCDAAGKRVAGRKDVSGRTVEWYYLCQTAGCIAAKERTPQPLRSFAGGN